MQKSRGAILSRLGGISKPSNQLFPRVEYVNRSGDRVNPHNGKPYSRPVAALSAATNGIPKKKRSRKNNIIRSSQGNKYPIKTTGIMFGGLNPIPTNPTIDPPPRVCYNCWQPGHSRKQCTRPIAAKICNNCGRRGEDLTTCPRCRVAHIRYLAHTQGEKLNENDLRKLFPQGHHQFESEAIYNEAGPLEDGIDETIQQLIEQDERERELSSYYAEHGEVPYPEPQVKYVETREYVKNPVTRFREYEQNEVVIRHCEDYDHEAREGSYDETRERETFPRYRERESSEDRSIERSRRDGNSSNADLESDPVKEILQLTKSIAHLSPETQELIIRQVMAERKEKARLRAMTMQDRIDEDWP